MSLKDEITPDIIANTICQDIYDGFYILVEGDTDELFFSKFLNPDKSQIEICHGKENVVEAINIINQRNNRKTPKTIAIIDKDYDFLDNVTYPNNVIQTDFHDVEMMCLKSDSFDNVAKEYFSKKKIEKLKQEQIECIRSYFLNIIKPISELRILSKKEKLNLSFKATEERPKELKFEKFVCKDNFVFKGYDDLINAVKTYYNQATFLNNEDLIEKIKKLDLDKYDAFDICHGHDLSRVIQIGLKKKIGKNKLINVTVDEIERALRLAYSLADFSKTDLKKKVDSINQELVKNYVA